MQDTKLRAILGITRDNQSKDVLPLLLEEINKLRLDVTGLTAKLNYMQDRYEEVAQDNEDLKQIVHWMLGGKD